MHIGADETWDLGAGRTRDQVQAQGHGPVYVAFLKQIHDELAPLNRRLLFWGDIGGADPDAVAGLPKDMIAVPWNYWSTTGFDKMIEPFAKAGIETWVAPGDANWNEVYPQAQDGLVEHPGLHPRRTAAWIHRRHQYRLERRRRRPLQPGLVRRAVWPGGFVAGRREPHSRLPGCLRCCSSTATSSGKINEAEKELMAANEVLGNAEVHLSSDDAFLARSVERAGAGGSAKLLPQAADLRLHAEHAVVLLAQARRRKPGLERAGCARPPWTWARAGST